MQELAFNQDRFDELFGKVFTDVAGSLGVLMSYIGDQSGVYKALESAGPSSSAQLAKSAQMDPRYLQEWLSANAAAGYVTYEPDSDQFSLSPEQAAIFAHEGEPTCMQGFFELIVSQFASHEKAVETFRSGAPRAWGEHPGCCFCGTDRFFRPGYEAALVQEWIPALNGVDQKLRTGGLIADIGCGLGASSRLLARHYPSCQVRGFDFHAQSIEQARQNADSAELPNLSFSTSPAKEIPRDGYDLVCIFDALHDMGDPVGAARRIRESLAPGGTFMLVEPLAGDSLADNLNPLGAVFYAFSTTICTPASRAQEVGLQLGAQAGEKRLTEVLNEAGFSQVRRAAETATNMVLEIRV